ncbi:hypothetical protein Q4555_11680 [Octadecabacter sp. 1_MG-2023]|uniref:hypothetical protein n=1 Tax=unclassified Octadecabacter TaxID=196158 RepID=UPI001C08F157|nr:MULTISPECIES: hypothetical protein [unclassified Octadecabacter]MBU2993825.1 hypothetical protein [Octadecabacter sp. B2R22]MDO6735329.1 hypothetical protein [Octadecabacter sp. 1_MG-2023]
MASNESKPDFYSGIPWVYVPPEQARAHPKGQLNWIMWLISLYFIGIGLFKIYWIITSGYGIGTAFLNGTWPVLTGVGLMLRFPYAVMMAVITAGFSAFTLLRGIGDTGTVLILMQALIAFGILFYLIDGDRPNFIYRHRYRKYSAANDGSAPAADD